MKKLIIGLLALVLLLTVTACPVGKAHIPIPTPEVTPPPVAEETEEAPDDIMPAPGLGPAYRANIHQQGEESPWQPIEVFEAFLGNGSNEAHIYYRKYIETQAGETRNNIIKVIIPGKEVDSLTLYADYVPQGIILTDGMQWSGPSARASVLVIELAHDVAPGEYPLEIGLKINGEDYGTIPCTIEVVEEIDWSQQTFRLDHARPYLVVAEGHLSNEDPSRSVGLWLITSKDASSFEEYAQTAVQAALDLYDFYRRDFTSVRLIPRDGIEIAYAQANFAADGRGPAGMTGSAPAVASYWKIWAADRELNERELAIAELWSAKQQDFPQQNPLSSLSYDVEALRQYIADTLNIPYEEVQMPELEMCEYELDQSFIDWTVSLAAHQIPSPSSDSSIESTIKVEPSPGSYLSSGDELSGVILKDVQIRVDACDKEYFSPWYPSHTVKKGDPCLVVSGHIQNMHQENSEIAMYAEGYDKSGEQVAWTLDAAHIAGQIGLHLEYEETGEFTLHLNLSESTSTIRIYANNYSVTPP